MNWLIQLRSVMPMAVFGANVDANLVAVACLPLVQECRRSWWRTNAARRSPCAKCGSPASTYACAIAKPVPSPASSDTQAAASPIRALAPSWHVDQPDLVEVQLARHVQRRKDLRAPQPASPNVRSSAASFRWVLCGACTGRCSSRNTEQEQRRVAAHREPRNVSARYAVH
jgi:hypothetical protein